MHTARKFARERGIDHPVALDAALSAKRFRYDMDSEMALAARPVAGMTLMAMGFVFDMQAFGIESLEQLFNNEFLSSHNAQPY